jgi:hypothetical protein
VILGVAVQQRVAALHGQQAGIKRGRNQVLRKLGHDAEVHRALLLVPVIDPLESATRTHQSTYRPDGRRTQSEAPGVQPGIASNHE